MLFWDCFCCQWYMRCCLIMPRTYWKNITWSARDALKSAYVVSSQGFGTEPQCDMTTWVFLSQNKSKFTACHHTATPEITPGFKPHHRGIRHLFIRTIQQDGLPWTRFPLKEDLSTGSSWFQLSSVPPWHLDQKQSHLGSESRHWPRRTRDHLWAAALNPSSHLAPPHPSERHVTLDLSADVATRL